jgi:hypothetical protein
VEKFIPTKLQNLLATSSSKERGRVVIAKNRSKDITVDFIIAAGKLLDSMKVPMRGRKAWAMINGKVVMIDAEEKEVQGKREGRQEVIGRYDGFNLYNPKEIRMTLKDLTTAVTIALPGSIGIAQAGQVIRYTLDALAAMPLADSDKILELRRKAAARKVRKFKSALRAKPGSANCILPRTAKTKVKK